eukprot:8198624-Alexandrium_andersonii.AAC.1
MSAMPAAPLIVSIALSSSTKYSALRAILSRLVLASPEEDATDAAFATFSERPPIDFGRPRLPISPRVWVDSLSFSLELLDP